MTDELNNDSKIEIKINPETVKQIDYLIEQQKLLDVDNEAYKEAVEAVAEKIGIKAGELKARIKLIIKEEEKGGEIKNKTQQIDFVEEYFTVKNNNSKE